MKNGLLARIHWVWFFDCVILLCLGVWLNGGFVYHDHLFLRHGADSRRAALILGLIFFSFRKSWRNSSWVYRGLKGFLSLMSRSQFRWGFYGLVATFAALLAVTQTLALRVTLYDVGIFHQILWGIQEGLGFHSTISKAGNFLADHYSPSLGLLRPLFSIFGGSVFFLPVMQVILLFGGGAAWILLASRLTRTHSKLQPILTTAVTLFILFFDSLWKNLRWGFHENAIAFFTLSWGLTLLLTLDKVRKPWHRNFQFFSVLVLFWITALSKEVLLLDMGVAFLCWAYLVLQGRVDCFSQSSGKAKERQSQAILFGIYLITALVLFWTFIQFELTPHPADKNYFNRYYSYLGENLGEVLRNFYKIPILVIHEIGIFELAKYVLTVFGPWLFLPFYLFRKRVPWDEKIWFFVLIPSFASAALSTFPLLRKAEFHYVLELWPILACLTILALARLKSEKWIWAWVIVAAIQMDYDPIGDLRTYLREAKDRSQVRAEFLKIPPDASVAADEMTGTWLARRKYISRWPDLTLIPGRCPDWIVVMNAAPGSAIDHAVQNEMDRCHQKTPIPQWTDGVWWIYQLSTKE